MKRLLIQLNVAILLLFAFSFHCMGADTYTLEYKLENGKTYKQSTVTTTKMKMDFMGQEMSMDMKSEISVHYDVLGQNDGVFDVRISYKTIKMSMSDPMPFNINVDASSPDNSPEGEIFKLFIENPFEIQLTKLGKVLSVKGIKEFIEKINTVGNQQLSAVLSQQISDKGIQAMIEQLSTFFPGKPVIIGESWDMNQNLNANGADIISKMKLTLKQVKDNIATLDCVGTLTTPEGGAVMNINGMDATVLMKGVQSGTVLVDAKTGWIVRSEINNKSTQDIEIMGQTMVQNLETNIIITAD